MFEEAEDFECVFVVYCVLESNKSAPVRQLLGYDLLFVRQLYEDKSLMLHARDKTFLRTDLQTVNY